MASSELTRVVTGKSTIPVYDTLTGTLTTNAIVDNVLDYTGPLTAQDVFGADYQKNWAINLYVYENTSTHGSLRKIKAVYTPDSGVTWSILVESAFDTPLAAENLKIVTANLADYSVGNQGDADGYYDEVVLGAGATIERKEETDRRSTRRTREAKAIDATGTSFLITENI